MRRERAVREPQARAFGHLQTPALAAVTCSSLVGNKKERAAHFQSCPSGLVATKRCFSSEIARSSRGAEGAEGGELQPVVRRYRRMFEEATQLFTQLQGAYRRGEVSAFELMRACDERLDLQADYLAAAQRYLKALGAAQHRAGMMPTQL